MLGVDLVAAGELPALEHAVQELVGEAALTGLVGGELLLEHELLERRIASSSGMHVSVTRFRCRSRSACSSAGDGEFERGSRRLS